MQTSALRLLALVLVPGLLASACGSAQGPSAPPGPAGDTSFATVANEFLEDVYRRQPTQATYLGIHKYDDRLEDYSKQAVADALAAARGFRERLASIDPASLSLPNQLDREQLLHAIDSRILTLDVVRPWAKDADTYSSGITSTAYLMIKRAYATAGRSACGCSSRARRRCPNALAQARLNIDNPPRIYTEIAIEQIDGSRGSSRTRSPTRFPT